MKFRAVRDSIGFMDQRWREGDITPDIEDEALLSDPALKHFEPIGAGSVEAVPADDPEDITFRQLAIQQSLELMTVAQLREYAAEHGTDLPSKATKAEILELLN